MRNAGVHELQWLVTIGVLDKDYRDNGEAVFTVTDKIEEKPAVLEDDVDEFLDRYHKLT